MQPINGCSRTPRSDSTECRYSWEGVNRLLQHLLTAMRENAPDYVNSFDTILAITRGGLVPAAFFSHALGIHKIEVVGIRSYDDKTNTKLPIPLFSQNLYAMSQLNRAQTLVVDDIADSGSTMQAIRQALPNAIRVVMVTKPLGREYIHMFGTIVDQKFWVKFPYEVDQTKREPR